MKKLNYIFMGLGLGSAISSAIIAVMNDTSYTWQLTTAMWIVVAILQQVALNRNDS